VPLVSKLTETLQKLASKGNNIPLTGNNNFLTRLKNDGVPNLERDTSKILELIENLNQVDDYSLPLYRSVWPEREPEIINRIDRRTGKEKQLITPEGLRALERARKDTEKFRSVSLSVGEEKQKDLARFQREAQLELEKEIEREVSPRLISLGSEVNKEQPIIISPHDRRQILQERAYLREAVRLNRSRKLRGLSPEAKERVIAKQNSTLALLNNIMERFEHRDSRLVSETDILRLEQGLSPEMTVKFANSNVDDPAFTPGGYGGLQREGLTERQRRRLDTLLDTPIAKNINLPDRLEEKDIIKGQLEQEGHRRGMTIYESYVSTSATGNNNFFTTIYEHPVITALDPDIKSTHFLNISKHFDINYAYHTRGEEINVAKDFNLPPRERDPVLRKEKIKKIEAERRLAEKDHQSFQVRHQDRQILGNALYMQKMDLLNMKLLVEEIPPIRIIFEIQADTQLRNYELTAKDKKVIQDLEDKRDKLGKDAPNKDELEMEIADKHGKLIDWISEKFLGSKFNDLTDIQKDKILTPFRRRDRILSNFSSARDRIEKWRNLSGLVKARYAIRMLDYQNTDFWQTHFRPRRRTFQQETPLFKSFFNEEELTEITNQRVAISNLWDTINNPTRQSIEYDELVQEIEQTKYELKNPPIIHKINVAQNAVNQEIAKAIENNVEEIHFLINPGGERTIKSYKLNPETKKWEYDYFEPGEPKKDEYGNVIGEGDTRIVEEVGNLNRSQKNVQGWYETTVVEVIEKAAKRLNARTEWSKKGEKIGFMHKERGGGMEKFQSEIGIKEYKARTANKEFLKIILPVGVTVAPLTLYGQEHKEASFLATAQDIGIDINVAMQFLNEEKININGRDNTKLINSVTDLVNKYSTASKEDKASGIKEFISLLEDVEPKKREKTTPIIRTPEEKFGSIYSQAFGEQ